MRAPTLEIPRSQDATGAAPAVRFEALDSWRGLAAIMVVLFHAQIVSNIRLFGLVRSGEAFVDFFFVLSGFVIAHAYLQRLSTPRHVATFFILRLGRLYPLHIFMLALFVLFEMGKAFLPGLGNAADPVFSGTNDPSYLISNMVFAQALWPFDQLSWNTPSWSISAEFLAYALFALAVFLQRSRLVFWLGLAIVAAPVALAALSADGMGAVSGLGGLRAVYGFSVGALLYILFNRSILRQHATTSLRPQPGFWTVAEGAASAGAIMIAWKTHATPWAYGLPFVFALVVGVFAVERGHLSRLLKLRPFALIGLLSYSIYMTHMFLQLRLLNVARLSDKVFQTSLIQQVGHTERYGAGIDTGNLFVGDLIIVGVVLVTVAFSYLTYRLIEKPGQRMSRRIAERLLASREFRRGPAMKQVEPALAKSA
ncbi:acyltransferase [Mesorhizobium sp. INR15]|uniref:acyltransferase family protein n=1 Tax=Mesorhizobium sp. INR15 TaxID=2654248 RepID=UPI001896530E|nr:acyltransferase [Mesorhizobium sp. INR15]